MDAAQLADLIDRAQRQDPAAFETLVGAYSTRLYGFFYRWTGSRHEAEDLLQELFVRLVRMIGEYQHDGRFDGWIFRIATNLVRDRVRKTKNSLTRSVGGPAGSDTDEADPMVNLPDGSADQPGGAMQRGEEFDRLQQAMARLPEGEREVILLRHFSQLSFRKIAETMGTPLGTALARAHRGLSRLRELMEDP